jgi:hypothetical protein
MGAYYAKMSYQYSGKYSSTPKEISNLYAAGRHYDLAITFLTDSMENTKDADTRGQFEEQIKYLFVEKYIEYLEKGIARYKRITGRYPKSLQMLPASGIIKDIPKDPFGGKFVIVAPGAVENRPYNRYEHFMNIRNYDNLTPDEGRERLK